MILSPASTPFGIVVVENNKIQALMEYPPGPVEHPSSYESLAVKLTRGSRRHWKPPVNIPEHYVNQPACTEQTRDTKSISGESVTSPDCPSASQIASILAATIRITILKVQSFKWHDHVQSKHALISP
jgi:hypothetical protein